MASGLGAIILILILVKQDVAKTPPEIGRLQADLVTLQAQDSTLKQATIDFNNMAVDEMSGMSKVQAHISTLKANTSQISNSISQQQAALSSIKNTLKNAPAKAADDIVKNDAGGEENYVMGLKVEGRNIVFLIDSSASMTDEKLIDIIRRKNTSNTEKQNAPKWQRTKRIVHWLLARSPKSSRVTVIAYHKTATVLGGIKGFSSRDSKSINKVFHALDQLVPTGSTHLQHGLQKAKSLNPTDIYLLTDGLPTDGPARYASLNPFGDCSSLLGKSTNISGNCRVKLFRQTIAESASNKTTKINVILLPIEGDPQAAPEYWRWTAITGGLLISPATNWP